MRKYLFWFWLMCKRMIKKKAFVLFLLLLPVMSVVITALEKQQDKDGKTGAVAGILWEGSFEEERQKADEAEQEGQAVSRTEQEGQAVGRTEQESQTVDEAEQEGQAVSRTKQEGQAVGSFEEDEQKKASLQETAHMDGTWIQRLTGLLSDKEGAIRFRFYEKEADFLADIATGKLDCGAVVPAKLQELVMSDQWQGAITICHTSSSSMTEIVKENIASAIFTLYAEEKYAAYVEETEAFQAAVEGGSTRAEIVSFAKEAYETHLLDGSTFSLSYQDERDGTIGQADGKMTEEGTITGSGAITEEGTTTGDGTITEEGTTTEGGTITEEGTITGGGTITKEGTIIGGGTITGDGRIAADGTAEKVKSASSGFRLKGILALCIFLSGLCGLLTDWEDRKEKRFMRVAPGLLTTIVNIWIPTLYTSLIALFCLILTRQLPIPLLGMSGESGTLTGLGGFGTTAGVMLCIGKELCHLVFYQFLIVVYCSIIRLLVRRQELIAAAIPILTLASMICSPVWIRLSLYLPAFRILEKFFPATYYLLL